jgi:hypothetical protein
MFMVLFLAVLAQLSVVVALMGVADSDDLLVVAQAGRSRVFLHASLYLYGIKNSFYLCIYLNSA